MSTEKPIPHPHAVPQSNARRRSPVFSLVFL